MRTCAHCGGEIPSEERKGTKYCSNVCKTTAWREANREKANESSRRWREANREKVAERSRRYREANPEKVAEQRRRYIETGREKRRQYYEANREKRLHDNRVWHSRHKRIRDPEEVKVWQRRYRERLAIEAIDLMNDIKEQTS